MKTQSDSAACWHGDRSRKISRRLILESELVLTSPAHLSAGDAPEGTHIPLMRDAYEGKPLLTGASIAGAVRSYLLTRFSGFEQAETTNTWIEYLFGNLKTNEDRQDGPGQSRLIIDDAIGYAPSPIESRDGVHLSGESHTAADTNLYTHDLWPAGTIFPLRFELLLYAEDSDELIYALEVALQGFQKGGIRLGARKQRGWGTVDSRKWRARLYDLHSPIDLIAWLRESHTPIPFDISHPTAASALGIKPGSADVRQIARFEMETVLESALLIRSGDRHLTTHLHSRREDHERPILSGTSLTGALRTRAEAIVRLLHGATTSKKIVDGLFGPDLESESKRRSRIRVDESIIEGKPKTDLQQNRVSIDRFTGGALDTALFTEQPVFANGIDETLITISLEIQQPRPADIGLLLLVLRDLWTADLPLGGTRSVGRGRLRGHILRLTTSEGQWEIHLDGDHLRFAGDEPQYLETHYLSALMGEAQS